MIAQLIPDIYQTLTKKDGWFTSDIAERFSNSLALRLQEQFAERTEPPRLRLSQMGPKCPCALWHSIHHPELAEKMPAYAENKFAYGHMIEAWAIALARAAGHEVTGEQDVVAVDGVQGHRDCVIDGCIVDVKSSTTRSMEKFKNRTLGENDLFGYLDQLDGYLVGSLEDPLVRVKDKAYLLAIDKQLGHMVLYEHRIREEQIRSRIRDYKSIVASSEAPRCTCGTTPQGKSGNIQLDTRASYSLYKHCCFPNLRTFIYADGPIFLTTVVRKPEVMEVDRHGNLIY